MANITRSARRSLWESDPRAPAAIAGWNDALAGRPHDPAFVDHPNRGIAATYQNWRLRAALVRSKGIGARPWVDPATGAAARSLAAYALEEDRMLGLPATLPLSLERAA